MRLDSIRPVPSLEYQSIHDLIEKTVFLPKHSWSKPLADMALDGLVSGKWRAYGAYNEINELMAYLDYKECQEGIIEIGIVFTREEFKGNGLMKLMLHFLLSRYSRSDIICGTYEKNGGMIACLKSLAFEVLEIREKDRVDGSSTIVFIHKSNVIHINNDVSLRKMRIGDLPGALKLWHSSAGVKFRSYDDSEESIARFLNKNPDTSLVLEQGNEIVGTLLCGNDGRRGFLYHFIVREDLRNMGLGTQMLKTVYKELNRQGIPKAGLVAFRDNISGLHFWQNNNWDLRDDLYYLDRPLDTIS